MRSVLKNPKIDVPKVNQRQLIRTAPQFTRIEIAGVGKAQLEWTFREYSRNLCYLVLQVATTSNVTEVVFCPQQIPFS